MARNFKIIEFHIIGYELDRGSSSHLRAPKSGVISGKARVASSNMLCNKLRWAVLMVVALALAVKTTGCNVTESSSASSSATSDGLDTTSVGEGGEEGDFGGDAGEGEEGDTMFGTLDIGGGNAWGHQGCTEEALWCPSLNKPLSRDPKNGCQFPYCP